MPNTLTADFLNQVMQRIYAAPAIVQRGHQYYRAGRVRSVEISGSQAVCVVEGSQQYEVLLQRSGDGLTAFCSCPYAAGGAVCKHIVASILTTRDLLEANRPSQWEIQADYLLQTLQKKRRGASPQKYAAFFALVHSSYYSGEHFKLVARVIKASRWKPLKFLKDAEEINRRLKETTDWHRYVETPYRAPNPRGCLNLPPEAAAFLSYIVNHHGYYGMDNFVDYLPLLQHADAPLFYKKDSSSKKIGIPLQILADEVDIKTALVRDGEQLRLEAGIEHQGRLFTTAKKNLHIISHKPGWVLIDRLLAPVANTAALDALYYLPLTIPAEDEEDFKSRYLPELATQIDITGEAIAWDEVHAEAIPRLYLRREEEQLIAELRFGYDEYEVNAARALPAHTVLDVPGSWTLVRVHRQPARETEIFNLLKDKQYGLKRLPGGQYGLFTLRARVHPYDFLTRHIPALTEAGFEIYGQKDALGKVSPHSPTISLNITSGIDWFDLNVVINYGDQQVRLNDVRRAIKRGERYVKLADGTIGQIPEQWLERYKRLFNLAEETEEGLRVSDLQVSLLDDILAEAEAKEVDPEFERKRQRLREIEKIEPQPLPQGFVGELRPYQKAGFDWLHFLRQYGFGGILADDMGLGKTVQMLAYLQSRKEEGQLENGALLVVPKSLIANWQREAQRFTPALQSLVHLGNFRKKDAAVFREHDLILTTYGTMLRDIELLRQHRFSVVVLDESQAIKNPVAKSARAARLLNAEQRLAMTGTPVENNTFELWSQFAFVNPGLLGRLDTFKREFAAPIESKKDEDAAALLKRLIYPFILRRTKEQVAPELPPRTERVIFVDLPPSQRKVYTRLKEYYRSQLLGLLDSEGIDNARMKILEGLLRLRQTCIHPALVEPTYRRKVAKFEVLLETMQTLQSEGHKALVFSQFVQVLKLLEAEMKPLGLRYTYLDGRTRKRQERVDAFQNDPAIPFFLISLKAGGVGLNLTAADYVIHLDPWWNPAVEMQAADRAHRIGQDKPVFVYKFIARDTVEEKILELQQRKKELVAQLIASESSFFKSLTRQDVEALFS
ncbi:MAG: serine/threonine protein kinase [Anaerolineae bacterium]|nr:MAG: serine/threonine protein kinase [Anaerolineae bacterium]